MVTGGCGFIGSAVCRYLVKEKGVDVLNVDKLTYAGNPESLREIEGSPLYRFTRADICDRAAMAALFTEYRPDAVMHLAAESHVDRSIDGPAAFIQTNIVGTYTLLDCALEYWRSLQRSEVRAQRSEVRGQRTEVRGQRSEDRWQKPDGATLISDLRPLASEFRFHHISTDEVYGSLGREGRFTETTPYDPRSPYSASKAASDHLVKAWHHTYGLPMVITNCSNNYGPYHFPEKLIPLVILNALEGKPLPVYGQGANVRDWLHVEDHARALVLAVEQGQPGQTYNIGGGNERTNLEVVETICAILDELRPRTGRNDECLLMNDGVSPDQPATMNAPTTRKTPSYRELITFVADRPGHDLRYAIDASKIRNELGWQPSMDFDTGIRATVQWYLDHEWWWGPLRAQRYGGERLGKAESAGRRGFRC